MQEQKKKNKETKIGKIIYGFLLFLPLFAIGTTCLISTFNMSSKEQSEIVYKYETNEVNNANDLVEGRIYHYEIDLTQIQYVGFLQCYNIYNLNSSTNVDFRFNDNGYFQINKSADDTVAIRYNNDYTQSYIYKLQNNKFTADIIYKSIITNDNWENYSISTYNVIESIETHNLNAEEVFYNSINKIQQSPLFNWSEDTLIYNAVETFTTALNINNSFFPQLMTYWLIITAAYLVYDIGLLMLLVCHRKIHELGDNI